MVGPRTNGCDALNSRARRRPRCGRIGSPVRGKVGCCQLNWPGVVSSSGSGRLWCGKGVVGAGQWTCSPPVIPGDGRPLVLSPGGCFAPTRTTACPKVRLVGSALAHIGKVGRIVGRRTCVNSPRIVAYLAAKVAGGPLTGAALRATISDGPIWALPSSRIAGVWTVGSTLNGHAYRQRKWGRFSTSSRHPTRRKAGIQALGAPVGPHRHAPRQTRSRQNRLRPGPRTDGPRPCPGTPSSPRPRA